MKISLNILDKLYTGDKPYSKIVVYGYEGEVGVIGKDAADKYRGETGWETLKLLAKPIYDTQREQTGVSLNKASTFEGVEYRAKHQRIQYGDF